MTQPQSKAELRRALRARLAAMSEDERRRRSAVACALLIATPEFARARAVMIYLSTPAEVDTAPIALRAWQEGKTVAAPLVNWEQRHMLPVEITSLRDGLTVADHGISQPAGGPVVPLDALDLVIVPGLGFSPDGGRIGRGMGFYDRFLAQREFAGARCGLAFEEQVVDRMPLLDHDVRLSMLVTDRIVRRFASS